MDDLVKPNWIDGSLELLKTEKAIFYIKQRFQASLAETLCLTRVSAPLVVNRYSGIQDNLNGIEQPVTFRVPVIGEDDFEIVQSLAKWKRFALARYSIPEDSGIYTDMNALRPDETTLNSKIHSIYVDQWDWEKRIFPEDRNIVTLISTVNKIYQVLREIEFKVEEKFAIEPVLPEKITFIHTEKLAEDYPNLDPGERENLIAREFGAVFIIGVGNVLADGMPHDGRAPDYDDWSTISDYGKPGLNGDIVIWNPVLNKAFEISSMGIRVDKNALLKQLKLSGCMDRANLPWHKLLINGALPPSIGGGIGQSRLCMFYLRKQHIGEVQASVWPDSVKNECKALGIDLL